MKKHIISEEAFKELKEEVYRIQVAAQFTAEGYSKKIEMEVTFEGFKYVVSLKGKVIKVVGNLFQAVEEYNKI